MIGDDEHGWTPSFQQEENLDIAMENAQNEVLALMRQSIQMEKIFRLNLINSLLLQNLLLEAKRQAHNDRGAPKISPL